MLFDFARASEKDRQFGKSAESYRKLCEQQPAVAQYHQRLGIVLTRLGQRAEGLAELERASQLEPTNSSILNDLGFAYLQTGDTEKAAEKFRKVLEIDPQSNRASNNLALALGYQGDLKESYRLYQKTLTEADSLENLGYLATQSGNTDLAVKAYNRVLSLEPERKSAAEALTQLVMLDRDRSETQSIARELRKSDETAPNPKTNPIQTVAHEQPPKPKQRKPIARPAVTVNDTTDAKIVPHDKDSLGADPTLTSLRGEQNRTDSLLTESLTRE